MKKLKAIAYLLFVQLIAVTLWLAITEFVIIDGNKSVAKEQVEISTTPVGTVKNVQKSKYEQLKDELYEIEHGNPKVVSKTQSVEQLPVKETAKEVSESSHMFMYESIFVKKIVESHSVISLIYVLLFLIFLIPFNVLAIRSSKTMYNFLNKNLKKVSFEIDTFMDDMLNLAEKYSADLGLLGTLIGMTLLFQEQNDLSVIKDNLGVVFATTILGVFISLTIKFFDLYFSQRLTYEKRR